MTITVKLMGGLGNQLFQYACARKLAHDRNTNLKLDVSSFDNEPNNRKFMMNYFNISASIASPGEIIPHHDIISNLIFKVHKPSHYFVEKHFHYNPEVETLPNDAYLDGYWQSEKYFKRIWLIIRKEFTLASSPSVKNQRAMNKIRSYESVSLHVRRGDYFTNPKTNNLFGICPQEYYEHAIREIGKSVKRPVYFIFSDDTEWARKNIETGHQQYIVDINGPDDAHEDLRLMNCCKYHIIANSSFSWWGAWLSDNPRKIVIAPKNWFKEYNHDTKDLIPEEWVTL